MIFARANWLGPEIKCHIGVFKIRAFICLIFLPVAILTGEFFACANFLGPGIKIHFRVSKNKGIL